ncbi:MAG: DUF3306 domain-containing protein [Gammaproteobacteria bacterium]
MSDRERLKSSPEGAKDERDVPGEPFLRRWSRLKADSTVRPTDVADAPVPAPAPVDPASAARHDAAGESEAETLPPGDEDMPPIESLTEDSDFSGFMSPRVSAALRKQALRKLFRSSKFNVISELDDYTEDFRNYPALGDLVTADMKHAAQRLLEKQLQAARDAGGEGAEGAEGAASADAELAQGGETPAGEVGAMATAATAATAGDADSTDAADAEPQEKVAENTQDDDEEPTRNA